jgi:hypothetical protein
MQTADAERQLAELLDSWWTAANDEGRDLIDDATARAAAVTSYSVLNDQVVPFLTPTAVLGVLDTADASNLDLILAALADPQAEAPVGNLKDRSFEGATEPQLLNLAMPDTPAQIEFSLLTLTEDFEARRELPPVDAQIAAPSEGSRGVGSVLLHAVWPMVVIVALLGVVLLWMG